MNRGFDKRTKIISAVLLIIILISLYTFSKDFRSSIKEQFGFNDSSASVEGVIEMHVIDVGQGDSILIKSDDCALLIDAGPNSSQERLVSYLKSEGISRLDCLVLTHPHEDHIGGADYVIRNFEIDSLLMPDCSANSKAFENLLDAIEEKSLSISIPERGDKFILDEINFTVLAPGEGEYKETNDYSIVLRAEYGDTAFMLTGDAEELSENEILDYFGSAFLDCDVLKAGHHGSSTSNSKAFVRALSPKYAAISCELDNSYGHPHREVRSLFEEEGIEYFRTDYDSDIVFVSDGKEVTVE